MTKDTGERADRVQHVRNRLGTWCLDGHLYKYAIRTCRRHAHLQDIAPRVREASENVSKGTGGVRDLQSQGKEGPARNPVCERRAGLALP